MKILSIISLLFSIVLLVFALYCKTPEGFGSYINIVGTLTTSIAFIVGSYFALLAVQAYGHIKDIDDLHNQIKLRSDSMLATLSEYKEEYINLESTRQQSILTFFDHQIALTFVNSFPLTMREELEPIISKRREELYRQRSLLAFDSAYLNEKTRLDRMREIINYGYENDSFYIQKCIQNECDLNMKVRMEVIYNAFLTKRNKV